MRLEVKRQMAAGDIASVKELLAAAEAADAHRPLGEHKWLDLVHGGREGFAALVAWEDGHPHPVGYAQVSRSRGGPGSQWGAEYVVDPHHRDALVPIGVDLLRGALGIVAGEGGGHLHLWVSKPSDEHDEVARRVGLRRGRDLCQMRRPLPVAPAERPSGPDLALRPFRAGRDEEGWLEVNNRAFRHHPEQGGWTLETLREREAEPWFDPDGFLLHEVDGRLAGFCWTKVHADVDPPLGEIYVIAVDPDFAGRGLGRALTIAGLDRLHGRGVTIAMLYVDAANAPAVRLYRELAFTVDHVDRAYVGDVAAAR